MLLLRLRLLPDRGPGREHRGAADAGFETLVRDRLIARAGVGSLPVRGGAARALVSGQGPERGVAHLDLVDVTGLIGGQRAGRLRGRLRAARALVGAAVEAGAGRQQLRRLRRNRDRGVEVVVPDDHECRGHRDHRNERGGEQCANGFMVAANSRRRMLLGDDLSHDCLLCGEPACHLEAMVQRTACCTATERQQRGNRRQKPLFWECATRAVERLTRADEIEPSVGPVQERLDYPCQPDGRVDPSADPAWWPLNLAWRWTPGSEREARALTRWRSDGSEAEWRLSGSAWAHSEWMLDPQPWRDALGELPH